jgi:hypothetical protein
MCESTRGRDWKTFKSGSKGILKNGKNGTSAKNCHKSVFYKIVNLEIRDEFGDVLKSSELFKTLHINGRRGSMALIRIAEGNMIKKL